MEFSIEMVTSNLKNHLDPNSDQDLRRRSHLFLERFTTSSLDLDKYGFYFAKLYDNTVEIQYYGLHLLEVFVKTRWLDYPSEKKIIFRNLLLVYFTDSVKHWPIQDHILKNSFAKVLTEIGKRDWITEWPTYLEDLLNIVQNGQYIHYEIILINLLRLSEDLSTHMDPNISSQDVKLLSKSLYTSHVMIFTFFRRLTDIFNDHSLRFVHLHLLQLFLLSIGTFFNNASLYLILCDDLAFIILLNSLLLFPKFRSKSVEILIILLKRKEFIEEFPQKIALFFYNNIFVTILNILKEDHSDPTIFNETIVQVYEFVKQVSELISVFTTVNMDFLLSLQLSDINQQYNDDDDELVVSFKSYARIFFDILDILVFHPSQQVTFLTIDPLNFLLRSNVLLDPTLKSKRHTLLENLCLKQFVNGDPNDSTHPASIYNKIDYSEKKEYELFSSRYVQLISSCICSVIKHDINFAHEFLFATFEKIIEHPLSESSLNLESFYLSWDVFTRFLKLFYMVVDNMGDQISNFYATTSYISNHLVGYQTDEFQIILHVVMVLKCIVSFIKFDQSNIRSFLLTIMKFLQPMPENNNFTDTNRISIHRHTLILFQKLIKICAPLVFPWFTQLYDLFCALRMELTIFNRASFLASLILINKQSDVDSQIRFISIEIKLHSDIIQYELFQILCFSSISEFIHFMGYDSQLKAEQHEFLDRYKLYNSIRILLTFFECYNHIEFVQLEKMFVLIIQGIYIPLLHLFRNCINIRSPNFSTFLHPHYMNLAKLCTSEILSLGSQYVLIDTDVVKETHFLNDSLSFMLLLHEANSRLLLKCFMYNQYLYNEHIVHLICENLFVFSTTNLICVRYLVLHFLQSFIIFCPLECYGRVLLPIIDNFVQKITDRLNKEWDLMYSKEEIPNMNNTTYSNVDREIVCIVSRDILRFINFIFHFEPLKPYDVLSQGVFSMQELNEELKIVENALEHSSRKLNTFFKSHFSHSQKSVNQILSFSKHALTWKDSVCTHWVTEFTTSLLCHHEFYYIDKSFIKETFFCILAEIKNQVGDPNTFHKLSIMLLAIINIGFSQPALIFDVLYLLPNISNVLLNDLRQAILNKETKRQAVLIKKILVQITEQEQQM